MARKKEYSEYVTEEIKDHIPKWKLQGQKDDWIAKQIGIGITTLKTWKNEYPSFLALFKKGQKDLLLELEQTLYTRAKGSLITEVETTEDNTGRKTVKSKQKYIWSDKCLEMALKRLDPSTWSDKLDIDPNSQNVVFEIKTINNKKEVGTNEKS